MKSQYCRAREPFSCYSHLIGAVLSAAGLVMLLVRAAREDAAPGTVLSVLLFGLSLVALYSASAVYHHALCGENALRVLKEGGAVGIAPEGNRTFSGRTGGVDQQNSPAVPQRSRIKRGSAESGRS